MAPASSATVRDAASALYVPAAVHVDAGNTFHGADNHAYAVALCTAAHGNPAAASTVARAAPGAAKSGYAAPPSWRQCQVALAIRISLQQVVHLKLRRLP